MWRQWRARSTGQDTWSRPGEAFGLFCTGCTVRIAGPTALVVGTLLSAVNQGSVLISGGASVTTWIRIAVDYVVPFVVSSVGYLGARRVRQVADDLAP